MASSQPPLQAGPSDASSLSPPPSQQPSSSSSSSSSSTTTTAIPALLKNDPSRTGYDPSMKWWMSYFRIITGQVTNEGVFHYREDRYRVHEERDCKRCEGYRDWLFQHSPAVRFMRDEVRKLGGELDGSNVVCKRCPARLTDDGNVVRQSGGFSPAHGILICANEVRDRGHLEDTLAHEMVHAWDHLRWKVDFVGEKDLRQAACTEIRASMLSGECRWSRETMTRGNWNLTQQFQNCVRKRAVQSVMARPRCKDDVHAVKVVNEVWDSCFSDTRPFNEVYR